MLFDGNAPQYNDYFDPALIQYNANKAKLNKAIQTEKKAHPWWTAASGIASSFVPFGLGAIITPAANAMVQANKKKRLAALAQEESALDRPQFSYGFGERGAMFAKQQPHTGLDAGGEGLDLSGVGFAAGSSIATGLGRDITPGEGQGGTLNFSAGLGGLSNAFSKSNNTSMAAFSAPQQQQPMDSQDNTYAPTTGSEGLYQAFQGRTPQADQYQVAPANNVTAPSNTGIQATPNPDSQDQHYQWGLKKGGSVIVDDKMKKFGNKAPKDNVALVNEETGEDTGVRVSDGEMLVVSKANIDALHKAIKDENMKKVFAIMKNQVKQKPVETEEGEEGYKKGGLKRFLKNANTIEEGDPMITDGSNTYTAATEEQMGLPKEPFTRSDYPVDLSYTVTEDVPRGNKIDWRETIGDSVGTGFDLYRLGEGLAATRKELPQFHKSEKWVDLVNRMKQQAMGGLTPAETALYNNNADRQYGADVANIYNLSGGSAGTALGNLGRANMNRYQSNLQLAALDRNALSNNLSAYGQLVGQDMGYDRQIFNDRYSLGMLNKQAGATLAADAIQNMQQRDLTSRYYGQGSQQAKLQAMYGARMADENDILHSQRNRYLNDPNAFNPSVDMGGTYDTSKLSGSDYDKYVESGGKMSYTEFHKRHK